MPVMFLLNSYSFAAAAPPPPPAEIAFDNRTIYDGSATSATHTFNHVIGTLTDGILIVKVTKESSNTISDIKVGGAGGTSLTFLVKTATETRGAAIWYGLAPPSGTQQIWINLSATTTIGAEAVTLENVAQTAPADSDVTDATGATNPITLTLTPVGTGNWLETVCFLGNEATTVSPVGPEVEVNDILIAASHRIASSRQSDVDASVSPGWTSVASSGKGMAAVLLAPGESEILEPPAPPALPGSPGA